jgi:hypothetical protein
MSLSATLAATALRLCTKYGESCTFTRVAEGSYNVATSAPAAGSTTTYTAYVVPDIYKLDEMDGQVVKVSDIKLITAHATAVPAVGDTVPINSVTYRVMNVQHLRVQGTTVAYNLQVRI